MISPALIGSIAGNRRRAAAGASFAADIWETYELAAVTAAELQANDNNASATWTVTDASGYLSTSTSAEKATLSQVNNTSDTGTLGIRRVYTTTTTGFFTLNFGADKNNASIGFWYQFSVNPSNNHCLIRGQNNSGSDALDAIFLRSSTRYIGWGTTGNNNGAALTAGTWYWITIQYNRNATSYLRVYTDAGVQVGSEATATAPNVTLRRLYPFNYNNETSEGSMVSYMDDLVIDYTDATFPLGP